MPSDPLSKPSACQKYLFDSSAFISRDSPDHALFGSGCAVAPSEDRRLMSLYACGVQVCGSQGCALLPCCSL